jgi:hypothetical protein
MGYECKNTCLVFLHTHTSTSQTYHSPARPQDKISRDAVYLLLSADPSLDLSTAFVCLHHQSCPSPATPPCPSTHQPTNNTTSDPVLPTTRLIQWFFTLKRDLVTELCKHITSTMSVELSPTELGFKRMSHSPTNSRRPNSQLAIPQLTYRRANQARSPTRSPRSCACPTRPTRPLPLKSRLLRQSSMFPPPPARLATSNSTLPGTACAQTLAASSLGAMSRFRSSCKP